MAKLANSTTNSGAIAGVLKRARDAQSCWARTPVRERLEVIRRLRFSLAESADDLAAAVARPPAETLAAEVLPLAEACRFLEKHAERLLAPKRLRSYRPIWLRSVELETRREPFGIVLIVGPRNYPLFLPGVQLIQSIVAGNAVLLKPGVDGRAAATGIAECLRKAGLNPGLVFILEEDTEVVRHAIRCGVDKVLITGSKNTGQAVLSQLIEPLVPSVAELSGWDPVFVLPDADLDLAARAIRFGVALNQGNTCIRPRTVFASPSIVDKLRSKLAALVDDLDFVSVETEDEAIRQASESEYALGATVFGSASRAKAFAARVRAGVVVVNDMIMPTAHPALAFGGRGASGFGVTRGAEGLLELTTLKTIAVQRSNWRPHLDPLKSGDSRMFTSFIRLLHGGGFIKRMQACAELLHVARRRGREIKHGV